MSTNSLADAFGGVTKKKMVLEQAYRSVVWVFACVRVISEGIAGCPIKLMQGEKEISAAGLYFKPTNPGIPTMSEFIKRIFVYLETVGGCYLLIKKKAGKVLGIELVNSLVIRPVFDRDRVLIGYARYDLKKGRRLAVYTLAELIPLLYFDPLNEYAGLAPLSAARLSVEQYFNMASWNAAYFEGGIRSDLIIKYKKRLTSDQRKDIHKAIRQYSNAVDAGRDGVLLLDGTDYDIEKGPNAVSAKDLDFVEGNQLTREDICSVFGVPPAMVGIFRYANYANTKEQRKIFWEQTAIPKMNYLKQLLQSLYFDIYFPGITMEWDLSNVSVLHLTDQEKAETAKVYKDSGKSWNEIAVILNSPELAGDEPEEVDESEPENDDVPVIEPEEDEEGKAHRKNKNTSKDRLLYGQYRAAVNTLLTPIEKRWSHLVKTLVNQIGDMYAHKVGKGDSPQVMEGVWMGTWKDFATPIVKDAMLLGFNTVNVEAKGKGVSLAVVKELPRMRKELIPIEQLLPTASDLEAFEKAVAIYTSRTVDISANIIREMNRRAMEIYRAGGTIQDLRRSFKTLVTETYQGRHLTIARTVNGGAYNSARDSAMRKAGAKRVRWVSAQDSVVRKSHADVDGQVIVYGEQFSNGLRYPHDPYGSAAEIINCRCTTAVVAVKRPKRTNTNVLPPENVESVIDDGTKMARLSLYAEDKAAVVCKEVSQINTANYGKTTFDVGTAFSGTKSEQGALQVFSETLQKQEEWELLSRAAKEHGEAMFAKYGSVIDDVRYAHFAKNAKGEWSYTLQTQKIAKNSIYQLSERGKEELSKYLMSQWDESIVAEAFPGRKVMLQISNVPGVGDRAFFLAGKNRILLSPDELEHIALHFNALGAGGEEALATLYKDTSFSLPYKNDARIKAFSTISHEMGHFVHHNSLTAERWAKDFFAARTSGESIVDIAYAGQDSAGVIQYETGLADKFWNSYQGRVYAGRAQEGTEVLSMFAEQNSISPQYLGDYYRILRDENFTMEKKTTASLFRAWATDADGYLAFVNELTAAKGF